MAEIPAWLGNLPEEDYHFLKRFLLASGSLKELADAYGVSYPTIRLRLDRLIDRVRALDKETPADEFEARIRLLVADGEVPPRLGRELLQLHKATLKGGRK